MAKIFFDCTICCEKCDSKLYCFAEARACFSENFLKAFSSNNSNFEIKEIYLKNPSFISEWSMIGGDFYCFDHAKDALKESIIKDFKRTLAIKKVDNLLYNGITCAEKQRVKPRYAQSIIRGHVTVIFQV